MYVSVYLITIIVTQHQSQMSRGLISGEQLEGVNLIRHEMKADCRGSFTEVFQHSWDLKFEPCQWSIVHSVPEVLRGMHYHRRHDEYFGLISGKCLVGLVDLRPESSTYLSNALYALDDSNISSLCFPRGILHGWYFLSDSIHLQGVSESFADYGSDDNFGCHWNDPELGIDWPFDRAILSERAEGFGSFSHLMETLKLPSVRT